MSELYTVSANFSAQDDADVEGVFSSKEKAQFYLDYIRDQDSAAHMRVEGPFIIDELVKDVRSAK